MYLERERGRERERWGGRERERGGGRERERERERVEHVSTSFSLNRDSGTGISF